VLFVNLKIVLGLLSPSTEKRFLSLPFTRESIDFGFYYHIKFQIQKAGVFLPLSIFIYGTVL
jgi:hypothetical protein